VPASLGQPCAPFFRDGDSLDNYGRFVGSCKEGLSCDLSLQQPVCTLPKKLGETCGSWGSCAGGLFCTTIAPGLEISSHKVSLLPNPGTCLAAQPLGAACDDKTWCQNYETCDRNTHVCTHAPMAGEPCTVEGPRCALGYCIDGTCTPWLEKGDACDPERDNCTLFLSCDANTRVCTERSSATCG
jgi:hypothetical protein